MPKSLVVSLDNDQNFVFRVRPDLFASFLLQTAASVLTEAFNGRIWATAIPIPGVAGILHTKIRMGLFQLQITLESQVQFLYESIPFICKVPAMKHLLGREGAELIVSALSAYQKIHEDHPMNSPEFEKRDWTDRSIDLLRYAGMG